MITIKKNGKFIIPENEIFVGHAGDNLNATKEFFVEDVTDVSLVYRMYLQFDDGSTNFFLLDSETAQNGTKLIWNVTNDQIYKGGILRMQIKASNSSGVVFHSAITSLVVHRSIEFGEAYKNKENSEFLQHEQYLNDLVEKERAAIEELKEIHAGITDGKFMDPEPMENSTHVVQSGGIYNALKSKLDNADGSVKTNNIKDGAVTQRKIMIGSITPDKLEPSFLLDINSAINAVDLLDTMVANLRATVENKLDDKDGSVKLNNLSEELQNIINYLDSTDYMQVYDVGDLTARTSLNDPIYTSNTAMWQLSASGELALSIKGEETAFTAELRYIAPYQIITDVETQQIYTRRVNKIAPNFSADAWKEKTSFTGNDAPNIEGAVSGDTVYVGDSVKQKLTLEWENGGVSTYPDKLGQEVSSTEYLRTDYCDVSQFASLDFTLSDSAYKYNILWFDSGKNCTGYLEHNASLTHDYSSTTEIPEGVAYARLLLHKNGSMTEDENSVLTVTGNTTGITDFRRMFEGKLTYQKADYSDTVFDDNVEEGTVYSTEYNGRGCLFIASKKRGAYIQFRFSSNGYEWREKTGASWTNWHNGSGNTASERVDISETTNNFTGSYELSDNTITVSGRVNISAETNTGTIRPTQYTPINTMSVIGVGSSSSKHYIVNVISSTPTLRFTVLNMDGTTPTETDTVRFTATLFKT